MGGGWVGVEGENRNKLGACQQSIKVFISTSGRKESEVLSVTLFENWKSTIKIDFNKSFPR